MSLIIFNPEVTQVIKTIVNLNEVVDKQKLEEDLMLALFCLDQDISGMYLSHDPSDIEHSLIMHGLVRKDFGTNGKFKLTKPLFVALKDGETEVEGTLNRRTIKAFVTANIDEYREIWGRRDNKRIGLRQGSLGDKKDCVRKMIKWFQDTSFEYSWEDVLRTARMYISEFVQKGDFTYLQAADYFISKDHRSRLSSLIEQGKLFKGGVNDTEMGIENEVV